MKKRLLIVGSGNVAGYIVNNLSLFKESFSLIGFVDIDERRYNKLYWGYRVYPMDLLNTLKGELSVAIAISKPFIKEKVYNELNLFNSSKNGLYIEFPNFIPKNCWISEKVRIGSGIICYPGVSINYEAEIGNFVTINMNCAIGHNCHIEDFSSLAPGINLAGFTFIEKGVEIGIGSCTRQNVRIGANAVVGGQSMVISDVPSDVTVAGIPAHILHKNKT